MPQEESAFEKLKRLDRTVQNAGTTASLVVGIIGTAGMIAAYPLYRYLSKVAKSELTPRILLLADELSEKN